MKDKKEKKLDKEKVSEEEAVDPRDEKIAALEQEVAMWKEKTYRTVADFDNLRKSYEKDHQQMVKYRGQPFIEKLIPTLDTFYLVLKNEVEDPSLKAYLQGFNMIYTSMLQALESEGVSQIFPKLNCEYDPTNMQAIDTVEGEKDNIVVELSKPGYMLRDRLVRPAMVVVSKVKKEDETSDESNEDPHNQA